MRENMQDRHRCRRREERDKKEARERERSTQDHHRVRRSGREIRKKREREKHAGPPQVPSLFPSEREGSVQGRHMSERERERERE